MTVETLIKKLQDCNPKAVVKMHDKDDEELLFVMAIEGKNDVIWLESESDNDMSEEIQARIDEAIEEGLDESDVVSEMLELGIDADMVRRNVGDDQAEWFERICEEYALV